MCQSRVGDRAPEGVLQKSYQALALALHKVIDHIACGAGHVSPRKSSDDLLLRRGNCEVVERRRIPDNGLDIVDHKFHYLY